MKNTNSLYADIVLHNGFIITMDPLMPEARALAIKDQHIAWVGAQKDSISWIGKKTQIIDLKGCYVYPGFIDTHMHILYTGITKTYLQLKECQSKESILKKIKEQLKNYKKGEWIIGIDWDDHYWTKNRKFNAIDLDIVAPDNPVVLVRRDTHLIWVNSYALTLAGISANTVDPKGGHIERDIAGNPTGILIDRAMSLIKNIMPSFTSQDNRRIIQSVIQECLQKGITTVHNAATDETDFEVFKHLAAENALNIRIYMMGAVKDKGENSFIKEGPQNYCNFLRLRYLKLWMDGALGSRGASLFTPYSDDLKNCGLLLWEDEDLYFILSEAKAKGFQVAIHAIGDKANHKVLDAYEKIGVKGLRWRIEHAQQLSQGDINRFAELEVIAAMQPLHLVEDMNWIEDRLGKERTKSGAFVLKSLLEKGTVIVGGSDAPVVDLNPLWGIYAAITREDFNQSPKGGWYPDQKITPYEAIKMYTLDAAYSCFSENLIGSLTKGKLADLVVLPENLLTCSPEAMLNMKVLYTFVNGKMMYCS